MAILSLRGVSQGYSKPVLQDLSLEIAEGEFVAVLGFSGSGKTTLINLLAGLSLPDRGEVLFRGVPVKGPEPERGLVFQSYSLMPWLTVAGNVRLATRGSKAERDALVSRYEIGRAHV